MKHYATVLDANYKDTISKMEALKATVDAFVDAPSADGYDAMKQAWLEARIPYGQCEFSRFYGGPLDQAQGAMNEWPIDENYVDYTAGNPKGGIINDVTQYPEITGLVLTSLTGKGGTENLATGFHALEFLIWYKFSMVLIELTSVPFRVMPYSFLTITAISTKSRLSSPRSSLR